jgi:hypothetical protein
MIDSAVDRVRARLQVELDDALLSELAHASRRRMHEGELPGYGAVVIRPEAAAATGVTAARTEFEDPERLRQLADGRTSFVERIGDDVCLWLADTPVTEADLVRLCRERGARVVRLDPDGSLHVVGPDHVWSRRRTQWQARATAERMVSRLAEVPARPGDARVLRGLLDLAVHVLGPRDVGATLVWLPDWERRGCDATLPGGGSTPLLPLTDRSLDPAVANLLCQHDGAALVAPGGALWWVGAELAAPPVRHGPLTGGGMRHRSAARFSRVRPDAWVVVVSQDGPVSVYVDGDEVGREDG